MLTFTPRGRALVSTLLPWMGLVGCRVFARLISVGAGPRGILGLTALTAVVNAYWLIAGPLLARFRRSAIAQWGPVRAGAAIAGAGAIAVLAEPAWYGPVLRAFNGTPLPWREAVIFRADVNLLVVALILAGGWLRDSFERALERRREQGELEAALAEAELRSLALQLQPHFLFNTLQLAAEAAFDDVAEARVIACELQTLLQRAFELEEHRLVRVADEVAFLRSYVAIQQRRFGSRLDVSIQVGRGVDDFLVPPLLLQPLVENSIRHGIGPLARNGRVIVVVSGDDERLRVHVRDNGTGFAANRRSSAGLGLGVTRRRLDALFPASYSIETGTAPEGGAAVSVDIPIVRHETFPRTTPHHHATTVEEDPRRWAAPAIVAALGTALLLADVVGSAYLFETTARASRAITAAPIAKWIPAQLLALALGVVLWRGRGVRRWIHCRDVETVALNDRISGTRKKLSALRAAKDLMILALDRLAIAVDAREFDDLVLAAADAVRTLLASDRGVAAPGLEMQQRHGHIPLSAEV